MFPLSPDHPASLYTINPQYHSKSQLTTAKDESVWSSEPITYYRPRGKAGRRTHVFEVPSCRAATKIGIAVSTCRCLLTLSIHMTGYTTGPMSYKASRKGPK